MKGTASVLLALLLSVGVLALASVAAGCEPQVPAARAQASAPQPALHSCPLAEKVPAPLAGLPAAETEAAPSAAVAEPGMRAYLDPESGTIGGMPVLPEVAAEEAAVLKLQDEEQPVETVLPDGSVMIELNGHGQEYFIVEMDASGRRVVRCVRDETVPATTASTPKPEDR